MPPPGRIRIIAGSLRGSRIEVPRSEGLRPTPDRVRETVFNWLQAHVPGAHCLDLFAGTGANGIEALSRGAESLVAIEREPRLADGLRQVLTRLKVDHARVVCDDALAWLRQPASQRFDLVFMDPPFALDVAAEAAAALETGGWLAASALIYVERPNGRETEMPANWTVHRQGRAGALSYTLYFRAAAPG